MCEQVNNCGGHLGRFPVVPRYQWAEDGDYGLSPHVDLTDTYPFSVSLVYKEEGMQAQQLMK